jgi:amidase
MAESLSRKTAVELASLIATKAVSPVEALDAHLATIARVNPKLNAIVTLVADAARARAKEAEAAVIRGDALGTLHGLPVAIKDITSTAGIRTTYGSPLFRDNVPTEDAEVVRRLKAAGAIVLGKTNTPEFGAGANTFNDVFGVTRNPWNPALSPAGSSGGSAVAAATGMVPLAQGTDFGCSIRMPASFCGIVGIRPTPGLTPNHPMPLAWDPGQVHGTLAYRRGCRADARRHHRPQPRIADFGGAALGQRACHCRESQRRERPACCLCIRHGRDRCRAGD